MAQGKIVSYATYLIINVLSESKHASEFISDFSLYIRGMAMK